MIERHLKHGSLINGKPAPENKPDTIIIHASAEYIKDDKVYHIIDWLDHLGLSYHYLILPENIIRLRNDNETAFHAKGYNINTIGISFCVPGEHDYGSFLEAIKTDYLNEFQYGFGLSLIRDLIRKHSIKKIVRHSDISPGRKVDPGSGLNWNQFLEDLGR